jgi:hypothetical protein
MQRVKAAQKTVQTIEKMNNEANQKILEQKKQKMDTMDGKNRQV